MNFNRFIDEPSFGSEVALPRPHTPNTGYSGMELEEIHADGQIVLNNRFGSKRRRHSKGDCDDQSCWNKFISCVRSLWATRYSENVVMSENQELYIKTTLRELIIYVLFLALLVTICFIPMSSVSYYFHNNIETAFLDTPTVDGSLTCRAVASLADLWKCLLDPFISVLHQNQSYNGKPYNIQEMDYINGESKILGLARIRQVRMDNTTCVVPNDFQQQIPECFPAYNANLESIASFGPANSSAWNYTREKILAAGSYVGDLATYSGGGFYVDLPRNYTSTLNVLKNLFENLWLDRGSRALFITFSVYNPSLNLFAICNFYFEMAPTGGIIQKDEIRIVKLIRYESVIDYVGLACECVYLLFITYYIVEEIIEIRKIGLTYLTGIGNLTDILVITISISCAIFSIYRVVLVNNVLADLLKNKDSFPNFEFISFCEIQYNYALSILLFLSWLKLFKYINFNKAMTQMSSTLEAAQDDLISFIIMFAIIFFAYAQLGYLAFGSQCADMSTFSSACFTLLRIILNDFDFNQYRRANRVFGPLYFVAFIVICFFILFNMFVAIISETYVEVNEEIHEMKSDFELSDLFKKGLIGIKNRLLRKKKRIEEIQNLVMNYDLDDIISVDDMRNNLIQQGHSEKDIDDLLQKFDINDDQKLSYKERLKMQADLQEKRLQLIKELEKDDGIENANLDEDQEITQNTKIPHSEVTMDKFKVVLKRVNRIESSITCMVDKLDSVITKLDSLEEVRSKRKNKMTELLDSLIQSPSDGINPQERNRKINELINAGLDDFGSSLDLGSRPSTRGGR